MTVGNSSTSRDDTVLVGEKTVRDLRTTGSTSATAVDDDDLGVQRIQLDITGMSCAACASRVESALKELPGVRASVNFATRIATIDAGPGTPATELCDAVKRAGYAAQPRQSAGEPDSDPDADHARYLLLRLAVAAVLAVPLADLSVMFAVVPALGSPAGRGC